MKTPQVILIMIFVIIIIFTSCEDDNNSVLQRAINNIFLAGDSIGNYNLEDYIIEKFPKDQDGMYYDSEIYGLSITEDYHPELRFEVGISGGGKDYYGFCYCQSLSNWKICLLENDTLNIKLLSKGDTLKSQKNWQNIKNKDYVFATHTFYENFPNSTRSTGLWNETQDGYMGIRLIENIDTIYGWIRIDISEKYKMIIRNYTIETKN